MGKALNDSDDIMIKLHTLYRMLQSHPAFHSCDLLDNFMSSSLPFLSEWDSTSNNKKMHAAKKEQTTEKNMLL